MRLLAVIRVLTQPAGDPMRAVDIVGLFVAMLIGLGIIAGYRSVAEGLGRVLRGSRDDQFRKLADAQFAVMSLLFGVATVIGSALTAMGAVLRRPGDYPGSPVTKWLAGIAMVAAAALLARHALSWRRDRTAMSRNRSDA